MLDVTNDFELASSMSPKVDKTKKKPTKKKAPSKLAVRPAFRRSSIYDHLPSTVTNKNLHIIDGSTENSSEFSSGSEKSAPTRNSYIESLKSKQLLSESKINNIQQWIEKVQPEKEDYDQNVSIFSTVSSIHGESHTDGKTGGAVNSTFAVGVQQKRFDDLFERHIAGEFKSTKKVRSKMEEKLDSDVKNVGKNARDTVDKNENYDVMASIIAKYLKPAVDTDINDDSLKKQQNDHKLNDLCEKSVIDDSLTNEIVNSDDDEIVKNVVKKETFKDKKVNIKGKQDVKVKNYNEIDLNISCIRDNNKEVLVIDDSFEENKENISQKGFDSPVIEKDCLNLLDKLYGVQWRANKDQVLPSSEPRYNKLKEKNHVTAARTEVKPKYNNPYLDSEKKRSNKLIGILDSARRKAALESPWVSKLKNLCDSDSENELKINNLGGFQVNSAGTTSTNNCRNLPQTRLQFDDDCNLKSNDRKKLNNAIKNTDKTSKNIVKKTISTNDFGNRKDASSSDENYYSCNDFEKGISTADKGKANKSTKKDALNLHKRDIHCDKERKYSISSDSSDDYRKYISKEKTNDKTSAKRANDLLKSSIDRCNNKERTLSISSTDSIDDFIKTKDKIKDTKVRKKVEPVKIKQRNDSGSSSDSLERKISECDNIFKRIDINHKQSSKITASKKPLSFLASLSKNVPAEQCDASAKIFKACYKKNRQQLLEKLFKMYNDNIFDNAMPSDMLIEWSDRLVGTAGYCACKKITRSTGKIERHARLVLSTKVLDSADRLRDTLVHELCHAATYLVNEVSDGHGPYWKAWAAKAMRTYPELPAIKRCHDYTINTKYTYRCTNCGYSFGRHSKSVDLNTKRCGYCRSTLEVFLNTVTKNGEKKSVATPKKEPTGFALFVKENYANNKSPSLKHADVMKILSKKFQETKLNSK